MCAASAIAARTIEGCSWRRASALGMRRLSIIDLATGHQPIHNEDGPSGSSSTARSTTTASCAASSRAAGTASTPPATPRRSSTPTRNGARARSSGCAACSASPCGTRGDGRCSSRAIASGSSRSTTPHAGDALYFGSEIKSMLAAAPSTTSIDPPPSITISRSSTRRATRSIFDGHREAAARPSATLAATGAPTRQYWQLPAERRSHGHRSRKRSSSCDACSQDAVRSHLMSEVPLGAFLSGGVDSSLVVGLMAQASSRRSRRSRSVSTTRLRRARARPRRRHALRHRPSRVRRQTRRAGDPRRPDLAFRRAVRAIRRRSRRGMCPSSPRRHVTVVLSGDGGDELFGGYDRYFPHPRVAAFDRWARPALVRWRPRLWPLLPHGARGKNFLRHGGARRAAGATSMRSATSSRSRSARS